MSKIFQLGEPARNFLLYSYALLGVFLTSYNLCRYFRKTSFIIPLIFIFFSGLDVIGHIFLRRAGLFAILFSHMEWWAKYFQYSANTTQLFWVFNQSIPTWLIMSLLLQLHDSKTQLALASLTFAYSTWAAIGIIPIALTAAFIHNPNIRKIFSLQNILIPLIMLVVYGAFYLMSKAATTYHGGFTLTGRSQILHYACLILLEFGIYFLIMGKTAASYNFSCVILLELMLIPCYALFTGDFIMRASIPPLFVLMTFLMKFFLDGNRGIRKTILIGTMLIGAWTPINEINRTAAYTSINILYRYGLLPAKIYTLRTAKNNPLIRELRREEIYSLGSIRTTDKNMIEGYRNHFLTFNYQDSFFFRYLAK